MYVEDWKKTEQIRLVWTLGEMEGAAMLPDGSIAIVLSKHMAAETLKYLTSAIGDSEA